jgi:hypothetical protein
VRAGSASHLPLETAAPRTLLRSSQHAALRDGSPGVSGAERRGPHGPACLPATAVRCAPRSGDTVQARVRSPRPLQMVPTSSVGPHASDTGCQLSAFLPMHKAPPPNLAQCHSPCSPAPPHQTRWNLVVSAAAASSTPPAIRVSGVPDLRRGGAATLPRIMQSAAAIGLVRPCAARQLVACPSHRRGGAVAVAGGGIRPVLPLRGLRLSARAGLVPASPLEEEEKRRCRDVAASASAAAAAQGAGEEAGGGLLKTLQLGALFGLWYLFNIYFNIYNKQVS